MDEELERARRAVREAPEDSTAAIRLAAVCERLGRFPEAWTALVRLVGHSPDEPALLRALGGLAARNPAASLAYLRQIEDDHARFSCATLGRAGEHLPLVMLAPESEESSLTTHAQIALRRAVAAGIPGLPGPMALQIYVQSQDPRGWGSFIRRTTHLFRNYSASELFDEMGFSAPASPTSESMSAVQILGHMEALYGAFGREPMIDPTFAGARMPPRRSLAEWTTYGRDLVERARKEPRYALLPWVRALGAANDTGLASQAIAAFQELTGKLAPPLDVNDLAARWPR
jgi:hypothetical protein